METIPFYVTDRAKLLEQTGTALRDCRNSYEKILAVLMSKAIPKEAAQNIIEEAKYYLAQELNTDYNPVTGVPPFIPPKEPVASPKPLAKSQQVKAEAVPEVTPVRAATAIDPVRCYDDEVIAMLEADISYSLDLSIETVERMEYWIKARITDRALVAINAKIKQMGKRQLNYQDIAVIALIHLASIRENDGYSMQQRPIKFSESGGELIKPIAKAHVHNVFALLETIQLTRLVEEHKPHQHLCAKYEIVSNEWITEDE